MIRIATEELIPAAGYIRMSSDKQAASPDRQRGEIETLAQREGYRIVEWFEDHGMTGTESKKRKDFQKLLSEAKSRRFAAVLMYEQSRMSREDVFDTMEHWKKLRDAGVCIVTSQRGKIDFDNLGGLLTAIIDQYSSHDEVVKLAHRVVSGMKRCMEKGIRIGQHPYAYDREIRDEKGELVRLLDHRERFVKPKGWTSTLVISKDTEAVEAVRFMFKEVAAGTPIAHVVRALNRRGVKSRYAGQIRNSRTVAAGWNPRSVEGILKNPAYIGTFRAGFTKSKAKFFKIEEPIFIENAHAPLVDPITFQMVQFALTVGHKSRRERADGKYLLGVLMVCGHCGRRVYGFDGGEGRQKIWTQQYRCYRTAADEPGCCPRPAVGALHLERNLFAFLQEKLLAPNEKAIAAAVRKGVAPPATATEERLRTLRTNIEKVTVNMALADDKTEFKRCSALISKWEADAAELSHQVELEKRHAAAREEFRATLADVRRNSGNVEKATRATLADALTATIESITLSREIVGSEAWSFRLLWVDVVLKPAIYDGPPVRFIADRGSQKMTWSVVLAMIAARTEPRLFEIAAACEMTNTNCFDHVTHLLKAGFVTRVEDYHYQATPAGRDLLARLSMVEE